MTMAQQIALWADQVRDIAAQGLYFARDIYDRDGAISKGMAEPPANASCAAPGAGQ